MAEIVKARSDADIVDVTALARDFVAFLMTRYPERADQIRQYLAEQKFEEMLANFRDHFNPPRGECMLARLDGMPVGIVMLKPVSGEICEMNRMFVAPQARGHGIGRGLCHALITEARAMGYGEMRLGALDRHREALPLYRSLGFVDDPSPPTYLADDPSVIRLHLLLETQAGSKSA